MFRKTYLEIDLDALKYNIAEITGKYGGYKYYFGVVKANAYGVGIHAVNAMVKAGINYIAVSSLEEALSVREINKKIPVLVLEPICFDSLEIAAKNNITVTVDNRDYFDKMCESDLKIRFHIKVDCGMNRFGLTDKNDVKHIVNHANSSVVLEGIFTQLSSGAGERYKKQLNLLLEE